MCREYPLQRTREHRHWMTPSMTVDFSNQSDLPKLFQPHRGESQHCEDAIVGTKDFNLPSQQTAALWRSNRRNKNLNLPQQTAAVMRSCNRRNEKTSIFLLREQQRWEVAIVGTKRLQSSFSENSSSEKLLSEGQKDLNLPQQTAAVMRSCNRKNEKTSIFLLIEQQQWEVAIVGTSHKSLTSSSSAAAVMRSCNRRNEKTSIFLLREQQQWEVAIVRTKRLQSSSSANSSSEKLLS